MFSVIKVRKDQKPGSYKDPGWFKHPKGTLAHEWKGAVPELRRTSQPGNASMPTASRPSSAIEVDVKKPSSHHH